MNPLFPTTKKSCSQSVHSPALVNTFPPKNIELSSQDLHKIFFGQFVYIDRFIALKEQRKVRKLYKTNANYKLMFSRGSDGR